MSIRITYRNNFFYYMLMPGLWIAGVRCTWASAPCTAITSWCKMAVILGAHCAWRWDEPLYRIRALRPLAWVLERTISTPATHWAHHALTNADGVGHYKGNFGNLLFVWDLLFGSAHITRQYPPRVGLQDDLLFGEEHWVRPDVLSAGAVVARASALRPGGTPYEEAPQGVAGTAP